MEYQGPNITQGMNAEEFERYLTQFLKIMRDSEKRFKEAEEAEQYPNSATQDILHAIELAPSTVDFPSLIPTIHQLRAQRREAKKELEVTRIVRDWFNENKKALDKLDQRLGDVRKVLARQPRDYYIWKTDLIGIKGGALTPDPEEVDEGEKEDLT